MPTESVLGELENRVATYLGTKHAVVCSSARNAIRFSLLALGIGHYDEVVVPDFACEILPITVFCTGARPRFCDVDKRTCTMTSDSLTKAVGSHTKAAILIHPLGYPADAVEIKKTAEKMNIHLIEDAAQSLGASINHKKTGTIGHVGAISFYKILKCNLGGAAVTTDEAIAEKIRSIRDKIEKKSHFLPIAYRLTAALKMNTSKNMTRLLWFDSKIAKQWTKLLTKKQVERTDYWITIEQEILRLWQTNALSTDIADQLMGYAGSYWHRRKMENTELTWINEELNNLDLYLEKRRRTAKKYDELLEENGFNKIQIFQDANPSYLRYPILVHDKNRRNRLIRTFEGFGFKAKYYSYKPLHSSPVFSPLNRSAKYPGSTYVSEHILPLPTDPATNPKIFDMIISGINAS